MLAISRAIANSRMLMRASGVLMGGLAVAASLTVWQLRRDALDEASGDLGRLGVVLAEQTARSIGAIDMVLKETVGFVGNNTEPDADLHALFGGEAFHGKLSERIADLPQADSLSVLDAAGTPVNLSRTWPAPPINLADRDYFQALRDGGPDVLAISAPVQSRVNGERTIYLARRLTTRHGVFAGIVVASMRLAYFDRFFAAIGLQDGVALTVLRSDGVVLAHFPDGLAQIGARFVLHSPWYAAVRGGGGTYVSGGLIEAGPRIVSVHPVPPYDVVFDVSQRMDVVLAPWRRQAIGIALGVAVASAALALIFAALRRQIGLIEGASARIRANEARLAEKSAVLEVTLDHINQGYMLIDARGVVVAYNRRVCELLDLPADLMARRPSATEVVAYQRARGEFGSDSGAPSDPQVMMHASAFYERRRPDGTVLEIRATPVPDGGMVRTVTDITARAAVERMMGNAASQDPLTGLANRSGFSIRLDAAIAAAQRGRQELAVLCLDLDRFKAVNDSLGHGAGDQLLILVAQRLRETARSSDIIARLGGDEFAIVLPGTGRDGAGRMCDRLLDAVRMPYAIDGQVARIGVSIGFALFPQDGGTQDELLRHADSALYLAKDNGRSTWRAYISRDGMQARERELLAEELRVAIDAGDLALAFQPVCDSTNLAAVGYEALLRWNNPRRGFVSPAEFVPLAEACGLIVDLERWAIRTACAEAAAWARPLDVAVNLSQAQIGAPDFGQAVAGILADTGLCGERLRFEVTGTLLLEDPAPTVAAMHALRTQGVRFLLDDFGTAEANMGLLRRFPFDAVKLDRSFMRALHSDRQTMASVEAILAVARAIGVDAIGTGVETQEQLAILRHLRCRLAQGYFLGRPASAEETREAIWKSLALERSA